jgi:hypothetical protein
MQTAFNGHGQALVMREGGVKHNIVLVFHVNPNACKHHRQEQPQ